MTGVGESTQPSIPRDVVGRAQRRLGVLRSLGIEIGEGARVLDFGCGAGDTVAYLLGRGFDAHGCDLKIRPDSAHTHLVDEGRVRPISLEPYRLPFDDDVFDLILSDQVFEHVQDYPTTIRELARITRPGGVGLHVFPARWRPLEVHLNVPLGGVVQSSGWLGLWAMLGVRNVHQRGLGAAEVAHLNREYLQNRTHYLDRRRIRSEFARAFSGVEFVEDAFLRVSPRARKWIALPGAGPLLASAYRSLRMRVVLVRDPY